MKRNLCMLVLVVSAGATSVSAFGGEIYKYVDDNGNVNYVDRPTGQTGEEVLELSYARTNNAAINAQIQSREEYTEAREKARQEELTQREAEETLRVEERKRATACEENRARLESYLQARRLYRETDAGEREYLSDSEALEARRQVEEKISEECS